MATYFPLLTRNRTTRREPLIRDYNTEAEALLGDELPTFLEQHGRNGLDRLAGLLEAIENRYPSEDEAEERVNAANGILSLTLDWATLEQLAEEWRTIRRRERAAMEALTGAIIWASAEGMPQTEIAERAQLNRRTVAKALGQ